MAWNQPGDSKNPRAARERAALEQALRRWQQRLRALWRPGRPAAWPGLALGAVLLVAWLSSGLYRIESHEVGVVERCGQVVARLGAGLALRWPWPVETLRRVDVGNVHTLDVRVRLLSADAGLLDIGSAAQLQVADAQRYLYGWRDGDETLRALAEATLRAVLGTHQLSELMHADVQAQLAVQLRTGLQARLDAAQSGLRVQAFELRDVHLPPALSDATRAIERAREESQRLRREAQAYSVELAEKAAAQAERQRTEAEQYRTQVLSKAEGDAARFEAVLPAYEKAPQVTRERLYLEAVDALLSRSRKIILDAKTEHGGMIYLPLEKLLESAKSGAAPVPAPAPEGSAAKSALAAPPPGGASAPGTTNDRGRGRGAEP